MILTTIAANGRKGELPFHAGLVPPANQEKLIGRAKLIWKTEFVDKKEDEQLKIEPMTDEQRENMAKSAKELAKRLRSDFGIK